MKETVKVKLFIHKGVFGNPIVVTNDMQHCGYALLATHEVEITLPNNTNVVEAEIEALYLQAGAIEAEALDKVSKLIKKAQKLQKEL